LEAVATVIGGKPMGDRLADSKASCFTSSASFVASFAFVGGSCFRFAVRGLTAAASEASRLAFVPCSGSVEASRDFGGASSCSGVAAIACAFAAAGSWPARTVGF